MEDLINSEFDDRTHNDLPPKFYELERRRSSILHELAKEVWGANFISPIERELANKKDFKVLDVGCGSSCTWLLQLSEDYPLTEFVGLDKLPMSPEKFSQKNLQFVQGDILKGLPFEDDSFDFVHMRFLSVEFTEEQWEEEVINELIRVCKPGGYVELLDLQEIKSLSPSSKRLIGSFMNRLSLNGINSFAVEEIPECLEATCQVDTVYVDEKLIPIGNWGGHLGKLALDFFTSVFRETKGLPKWSGVSNEEHEIMVKQSMKEFDYYHTYLIFSGVYCQKI